MALSKLLPLLLLLTACLPRGVRPEDAVTRAPKVHVFAEYGRRAPQLPPDLSPEVLSDDATLTIAPTEFCFDLEVRAPRGVDLTLGRYNLRCQLDRGDTMATVTSESPPTTTEFPYVAEPGRVYIWGTAGAIDMPIGQPQQRLLHVVERKGRACCPAHATREVRLVATADLPSGAPTSGYVEIVWRWPLTSRSQP